MIYKRLIVVLLLPLFFCLGHDASAADPAPNRFEGAIKAFEASDKKKAPPEGAILFVGSSSIRMWELDKSFPELTTIRRGFGGSHISDSIEFADRIILPYKPKVVVIYAGDNDINAGKTPEQVLKDYDTLTAKIHGALPKTRIIYIAIKPSIKRWSLVKKMRQANAMIKESIAKDPRQSFADIDTPMLGNDGRPRAELFSKDGLHLNEAGYALWAEVIKKQL